MLQSLRAGDWLELYAFTEKWLSVLEGTFGLRFPPGTYFQGRGA